MERRNFIKTSALTCAASCIGVTSTIFPDTFCKPVGSSCEKKYEFSQTWIKRFMENLETQFDKDSIEKLMELNGKRCYLGSLEHGNIKKEHIPEIKPEDFIKGINEHLGEDVAYIENNIIYFRYVKNPEGLRVEDGFCLCPFVESGPEGLSGLYCHCSVGYVKEMFETYLKKNVSVELLESLKRGGKTCKFKIIIA